VAAVAEEISIFNFTKLKFLTQEVPKRDEDEETIANLEYFW
jgi:hypothetical protein